MSEQVSHTGSIWVWRAQQKGSWHFLTIDGEAGEALRATALMRKLELGQRAGFGSLKVEVELGDSRWKTSVFPDKSRGWLLPIKAAIRKAEGVGEGDEVSVVLTL